MEDQKSPTTSSDEEKDSKLSLALVQDSLVTLAKEVKLSERRIQKADRKLQDAEDRAAKWEKLYRELKDAQTTQEESEKSDEAEEKKQSIRAKRKSEASEAGSDKRSRTEAQDEDDSSSEGSNGNESDGECAEQFHSLDEATRAWISAIGLENQYGTRHHGLNSIEGGKYVEPPSFEYFFVLADFLYPVEEGEETFHRRLFESESRPGIKVRQRLRRIKDETPDNPIVCWHQKGKQWIPPSVHAFKGIVRLIVSM